MESQLTHTVMMIRPKAFRFNDETARDNHYQQDLKQDDAQDLALEAFDGFVDGLRSNHIEVLVLEDTPEPHTPDAIFPNNWISTHASGDIILYPMRATNRRKERREDIVLELRKCFKFQRVHDMTAWEQKEQYLEGTGSVVLGRGNRIAYAALSPRTCNAPAEDFARLLGYRLCAFKAFQRTDEHRNAIYHTNVVMSLGEQFAVIGLDCIDDLADRKRVEKALLGSKKEVISLREEQVRHFAGNILALKNRNGDTVIVMSEKAYHCLTTDQRKRLCRHGEIFYYPLDIIESLGGGSARCMMAEIFIPEQHV
jgi:hypothetical protein